MWDRSWRIPPWLAAGAGALVLCLAAGLIRPYFHDEISTETYAGGSFKELWAFLMQDVHPPLYFLQSWLLLRMGDLQILRIFSALSVGLAAAMLAWRIGRDHETEHGRWAVAALIACNPLLLQCGYGGRYYAMLLALAAAFFLAAERYWQRPSPCAAALTGLLAGALAMTNYPAGILLSAPFCVAAVIKAARDQRWRESALAAGLPLLAGLCWLPFFLVQTDREIESRITFSAGSFLKSFVMTSAYGTYGMTCSDSLPPWTSGGLLAGLIGVMAAARGVVILGYQRRWGVIGAGVAIFLAAFAIGALTLPGAAFIRFPTRFSWLLAPWLWLVLRPSVRGEAPAWIFTFLAVAHLFGAAMLFRGQTTDWSNGIGSKEIAEAIAEAREQYPGAAVYIPPLSYKPIIRAWENHPATAPINPCDSGRRFILATGARDQKLPLSSQIPMPEGCGNETNYQLISERRFLYEEDFTRMMKELIMRREVLPYKLTVQVYERAEEP